MCDQVDYTIIGLADYPLTTAGNLVLCLGVISIAIKQPNS